MCISSDSLSYLKLSKADFVIRLSLQALLLEKHNFIAVDDEGSRAHGISETRASIRSISVSFLPSLERRQVTVSVCPVLRIDRVWLVFIAIRSDSIAVPAGKVVTVALGA